MFLDNSMFCFAGGDLSKLLPYQKPQSRPEPQLEPKVCHEEVKEMMKASNTNELQKIEIVYNITRSNIWHDQQEGSVIPPWGSFHAALDKTNPQSVSNVSFNPIIMANPTDHKTIYTTLMSLKYSVNALGQKHVPVFFDMGLMMKALEVKWAHPKELDGVILCDGGMHFVMCVISAIGYLYGDAGLKKLLHESGVFAAGSVAKMLAGKDFDRAVYALKLVDEALSARLLHYFLYMV